MNMEYLNLWYFLSKSWDRSYKVYKATQDQKFLEHCKNIAACEEIVHPYQFRDDAETGI